MPSPEIRHNIVNKEKEPLQDNCGFVAILSTQEIDAMTAGFAGLYKLQTRGYDGAGVCAIDKDGKVKSHYGEGMITDALGGAFEEFSNNKSKTWMFQTRYGTNGKTSKDNLQPLVRQSRNGESVTMITNGQYAYEDDPGGKSDTVQFIEELISLPGKNWDEKISHMHNTIEGAGSTVINVGGSTYIMRDKHGIRPLALGVRARPRNTKEVYMVASETAALKAMGVSEFREVMPGEIIKINDEGLTLLQEARSGTPQAPCSFENAYIQNGRSSIHRVRQNPYEINEEKTSASFRRRTGELLAAKEDQEFLANMDFVVGIPGTGIEGGRAYAQAAGIPYIQVIADKRPSELDERTFMQPDIQDKSPDEIKETIEKKFVPYTPVIKDKKIVHVDDSVVRGNMGGNLIKLFKRPVEEGGYGAAEVHLRVLYPPVDKPCHLGISTRKENELLAAKYVDRARLEAEGLTNEIWDETVEKMRQDLGADSLKFVTAEDIYEATGGSHEMCLGCTIGHEPPVNKQGLIYAREIQRA